MSGGIAVSVAVEPARAGAPGPGRPHHPDPLRSAPGAAADPPETLLRAVDPAPGRGGAQPSRLPHCGNEPTIRAQALQQHADLTEVWLEPDRVGELTESHHCTACAPHGPVTDLACAVCGDGPLLVGAAEAAAASGTITEPARRWLTGHGWQIEPELTCPHHTLAQ